MDFISLAVYGLSRGLPLWAWATLALVTLGALIVLVAVAASRRELSLCENRTSKVCTVVRTLLLMPVLALSALMLARTDPAPAATGRTSDRLWRRADRDIELSVVIPFYNPGPVIVDTVTDIIDEMSCANVAFEIIAVSDGSTDGSPALLDNIDPRVHVIEQPTNIGKGAALHTGFAHATGEYVGMIDADGDIDSRHLVQYLAIAQDGRHDVVYADKRIADSVTGASASRKVISWGFSSMVNFMFNLGVADTQTGCKVFHRAALAKVLPVLEEDRFAFDLEFFVAAREQGIEDIQAAPVTLNPRTEGSSVTAKTILRTLNDSVAVLGRQRVADSYSNSANSRGALITFPSRSNVGAYANAA